MKIDRIYITLIALIILNIIGNLVLFQIYNKYRIENDFSIKSIQFILILLINIAILIIRQYNTSKRIKEVFKFTSAIHGILTFIYFIIIVFIWIAGDFFRFG